MPLPADFPPEKGAVLEPLGVAIHMLEAARPFGESLLILGCGPIGVLAVGAGRALGATQVLAVSRSEPKLASARALGASATFQAPLDDLAQRVRARTEGLGVGVVLETTGAPEMIAAGLKALRSGGRMVLIGMPPEPFPLDLAEVILRELKLIGSFGRRMYATWARATELVQAGRVDVEAIIGPTYPLEAYEEAFARAMAPEGGKVLFDPRG